MGWSTAIDWSSVDTLRLIAYDAFLSEFHSAVQERCDVAGVAALADYVYNVPSQERSIHSKITTLIPYFVNHTGGSSGDFSGETSIPMWSVATMETHIGSTRPIMNIVEPITAEWIAWHYACLNLLRWTIKTASVVLVANKSKNSSTSWADAISVFNAAAWDGPGGPLSFPGLVLEKGTGWTISRITGKWADTPNTTAINCDVDSYQQFKVIDAPWYSYYNPDYAYDVNELAKIDSDVAQTPAAAFESTEVGRLSANGLVEPTEGVQPMYYTSGYILRKWNVTGGFAYQDDTV
jgi:hypothetical protein